MMAILQWPFLLQTVFDFDCKESQNRSSKNQNSTENHIGQRSHSLIPLSVYQPAYGIVALKPLNMATYLLSFARDF